jgi:hypothetical protein
MEKRPISIPCQESNPIHLSSSLWHSHSVDSAIRPPTFYININLIKPIRKYLNTEEIIIISEPVALVNHLI